MIFPFESDFFTPLIRTPERCWYAGISAEPYLTLHYYQPGYNFFVLDTLKLPVDTLMSPWIHLCRPGYTYVALDKLMSPWIHLCRPGYT